MRLESIKLAGFKSFVDPTILTLPSNLTAIVGPNGCGKSNIIDAIRWVLGENSAKQLRGQSLEDVIFNGCTTRKPLGQAAIEINFDNADANMGDQYSRYTHLSVRREITRDGQSTYYLNGTRCRRRDIRDIFFGTGLGSSSYAIIEQGMISRVVDAKPAELYAYIEEAAGISKYKERRHETENRLEHTQNNLYRLDDLRAELAKQINHLQHQANTAERYKDLKQEERLLKAKLQALRYRACNEQLQSKSIAIQAAEMQRAASQHALQISLVAIAQLRERQLQIRTNCDASQNHYYEFVNQITHLEATLQGQVTQFHKNQQEEKQLTQQTILLVQQIQENQLAQDHAYQELNTLHKAWVETQASTDQATTEKMKRDVKNCQIEWDQCRENLSKLTQQSHMIQTQRQYSQQQCQHLKRRFEQLEEEQAAQNQIFSQDQNTADLVKALHDIEQKQQLIQLDQEQTSQQIDAQRTIQRQLSKALHACNSRLQNIQGQMASLIALQEEALGQREQSLCAWLKKHNLTNHPRLAQLVQIETGWELAFEIALHRHLQAVCFLDRESLDDFLHQSIPDSSISLMTKWMPDQHSTTTVNAQLSLPLLSTKLTAPWPLDDLLIGIYAAETTAEAMLYAKRLKPYESIITREGIFLGNHWIQLGIPGSTKTGLLQRERDINNLRQEQEVMQTQRNEKHAHDAQTQKQLQQLEAKQLEKQKQFAACIAQQADLKTRYQLQKNRVAQAKQQMQRIQQERKENKQQIDTLQTALQQLAQDETTNQLQLQEMEKQHQTLLTIKTTLETTLNEATQQARVDETTLHQLALRRQTAEHHWKSTQETASRLQQQQEQLKKRAAALQHILKEEEKLLDTTKKNLYTQHQQRDVLATRLKESQDALQKIEQQWKLQEQQIKTLEIKLDKDRSELEQYRLQDQELRIHIKALAEQLQEQEYDVEDLIKTLPADIDLSCVETQLTEVVHHIEEIGAVNLVALEEHQAVVERKSYLDTQHQDLLEALQTLKTAIKTMDEETIQRCKETFEKINQYFIDLFSRLFSGGKASLQLQDSDLLNAGITITAQPPGKKNSRIQSLSGGEKALTAMALVFAFFQYNPAPFCVLDEVDASLDDANVLRFCKLVKEISKEVQIVLISHNKVAIAMAQHLAGITMHEPGVSRLVAVDMEKAMAIASV